MQFFANFVVNLNAMYTPEEIAAAKEEILNRVMAGESLEHIIKADEELILPSKQTVYNWLRQGHDSFDLKFFDDYAHARAIRAEGIFSEMLDIADETTNDWTLTERGAVVPDKEVVMRSKLRIETRQWVLARMNSKRFSDKRTSIIEGGDRPVTLGLVDAKDLPDEMLEHVVKLAAENAKKE